MLFLCRNSSCLCHSLMSQTVSCPLPCPVPSSAADAPPASQLVDSRGDTVQMVSVWDVTMFLLCLGVGVHPTSVATEWMTCACTYVYVYMAVCNGVLYYTVCVCMSVCSRCIWIIRMVLQHCTECSWCIVLFPLSAAPSLTSHSWPDPLVQIPSSTVWCGHPLLDPGGPHSQCSRVTSGGRGTSANFLHSSVTVSTWVFPLQAT